jgi:hypothetical protein
MWTGDEPGFVEEDIRDVYQVSEPTDAAGNVYAVAMEKQ